MTASVSRTGAVSLWNLELSDYRPHPLHGVGRNYLETNCYADVLIELLHAHGDEPLAMLGSIVRSDWEGDQFTYCKPRPADLERLYGIDVHEMLPYRPMPDHIEEQLSHGRTVLVEIDAWYLPDTAGMSYRTEHMKTTVAPESIDRDAQRMRYFHNAGYHELSGEDYRGAFRLLDHFTEDVMDPFTEVVSFDAGSRLVGEELRVAARDLLCQHYQRRPRRNPFLAWSAPLGEELEVLQHGTDADYHAYAFVTVRMIGSAFELCADHVEWVLGDAGMEAAAGFRRVVDGSKSLLFRLARRRVFDPAPALESLAGGWDEAMDALGRALG